MHADGLYQRRGQLWAVNARGQLFGGHGHDGDLQVSSTCIAVHFGSEGPLSKTAVGCHTDTGLIVCIFVTCFLLLIAVLVFNRADDINEH